MMTRTEARHRRASLLDCWRMYRRARRTVGCRDCADIPKDPRAGAIVSGDPAYQIMHKGIKVALGGYHGSWMAEVIRILRGHHEPQEERIFYEVLKVLPSGAAMMEVGSYWAYYSLWFRSAIPAARVYMIEPVPSKLRKGIDNFRLNGLTGVFRNAFVGAVSSQRAAFSDWDGTLLQLPCLAIDDFLDQEGIAFLDILHADIQGSEVEMLRGARNALARKRIGYVFVSTHPGKHEICLSFLRELGYKLVFEHSIEESCSGDGLIVARSDRAPPIPQIYVTKTCRPGPARDSFAGLIDLLTQKESRRLWSAIRSG